MRVVLLIMGVAMFLYAFWVVNKEQLSPLGYVVVGGLGILGGIIVILTVLAA